MIIRGLDIENIAASPTEADPVLIVNANTVLPLPAALQRLQTVAAKRAQIAQRPGGIQHAEFLKRLSVTLLKSPAAPGGVQPLRLAIPKRPDHCNQYNAKRYTHGGVAPAVYAAGGVVRNGKNTGDKGVPSGPGATRNGLRVKQDGAAFATIKR
jgi:hypothetical protein